MQNRRYLIGGAVAVAVAGVSASTGAGMAAASSSGRARSARVAVASERVFASGHALGLTSPDDLAQLGGHIFVNYQNAVGPKGQPQDGQTDSAVVEYAATGRIMNKWLLPGHCDGLTAYAAKGEVLATVNEDGNSSLFAIRPSAQLDGQLVQYRYQPTKLPHGGGTDAISIMNGKILISASAPSPAPRRVPAVYVASLKDNVATMRPLFSDEATATTANVGSGAGSRVRLALTDPDSNEVVPAMSPRFAGDFVLDSQGDEEQIYVAHPGTAAQHLSVLHLSQSINDSAWLSQRKGTLYLSDGKADRVVAMAVHAPPGTVFVAVTPGDANNAPAHPAPNSLGTLDLSSGVITPVAGVNVQAGALLFAP